MTDKNLADWDDPRTQLVYAILCDDEAPPNREEHWEGFLSRKIVHALANLEAQQPEPSAEPTVLTKPARVGNTIFNVGVAEDLVIGRAQREYVYRSTPLSGRAYPIIEPEPSAEAVAWRGVFSLRHLQAHLPWTIPYSEEFETSAKANSRRRIGHDVLHVMKSLGRIAAEVERCDHASNKAPLYGEAFAKEVADLVICEFYFCKLEVLDLHDAVVLNSEARNQANIPPELYAHPPAAQHPSLAGLREALQRLVDLKRMKIEIERNGPDANRYRDYYEQNKEAAWQQAITALDHAAAQVVSEASIGRNRTNAEKVSGDGICRPQSSDADPDAEDLPGRKDRDRGDGSASEFQPAAAAPSSVETQTPETDEMVSAWGTLATMMKDNPTWKYGVLADKLAVRCDEAVEKCHSLERRLRESEPKVFELTQTNGSMKSALSKLRSERGVSEDAQGFVMVPKEPTEAMIAALNDYTSEPDSKWQAHWRGAYRAMLSAAPSPGAGRKP